jgi:predicted O-methyltransferase YrrM
MPSTLRSEAVTRVLARLREAGRAEDEPAKQRVRAREAEAGRKIYGRERADLYGQAPIAVTDEVGELLYVLVLAQRPRRVVEFGTSLGVSTLYLASAIRDAGDGMVITTEFQPEKAERASANLAEAGLADVIELRVGDALETLRDLDGPIDLLFLDGWNDLYLPLLEALEPHLRQGALVAADMSKDDPHHDRYRAHVRDPANGYFSTEVPLDDGVVISVRLGCGRG